MKRLIIVHVHVAPDIDDDDLVIVCQQIRNAIDGIADRSWPVEVDQIDAPAGRLVDDEA